MFTIRTAFRKAFDVVDNDGTLLQERDTPLGAQYLRNRSLLSIDYDKALTTAATVLPDYDGIVVMINQPVLAGRANSFQLYYGGIAQPINSSTPSHEYGHSIGRLADEYSEFEGTLPGADPFVSHMTTFTDVSDIPWELAAHNSPFSVAGAYGQGHFEGGQYYMGGIFRASYNSIMRIGHRFNSVSLDTLWENAPLLGTSQIPAWDFNQDGVDDWVAWDRRGNGFFVTPDVAANQGYTTKNTDPDFELGQVVGKSDFESGSPRLLVRDQATYRFSWLELGGEPKTESISGLPNNPNIQVVAVDDFNNDGRSDALVRFSQSGKWRVYRGKADGSFNSAGILPFLYRSLEWKLLASGDFNGDGQADLLLRSESGRWRQFQLSGTAQLSRFATGIPASSRISYQAIGDFNGDGRDDVIVKNKDGDLETSVAAASGKLRKKIRIRDVPYLGQRFKVITAGRYLPDDNREQLLLRDTTDGSWALLKLSGPLANRGELLPLDALPSEGWVRH